jgi:hypothetical protein
MSSEVDKKEDRPSVSVLLECIDLQRAKGRDYQNPNSKIKQADYYRHGIDSIQELIWTKTLRLESLIAAARETGHQPNFEGLQDTYKDLINYASFAVSWLRGSIDGQKISRDMFNRDSLCEEKFPGCPQDHVSYGESSIHITDTQSLPKRFR